jgi:hypothetical protein
MWDLKTFSIYTLCSQEKNYIFSMWNKKPFWFKYFNLKKDNTISFQYEIKKTF